MDKKKWIKWIDNVINYDGENLSYGALKTLSDLKNAIKNTPSNPVKSELGKAEEEQKGVCVWREDESGNWWCDCKNSFCLNAGTPTENGFKFCCYCGKPLEECRSEEE